MLGTLENYEKSIWKSHVAQLVHAHNVTIHTSTGYSPYFLMFGRHPKLAIYAAKDTAKHSAEKHKARYDIRTIAVTIHTGDLV
jgi:hypothetical protein